APDSGDGRRAEAVVSTPPVPASASRPKLAAGAAYPAPAFTETVDILVVDDRPENLLALEAILEPLQQHICRASSGEEALRQLLERDFALILLDVQMPGLNGFETARLIKSRERTRYIPIIFLTAISKEEAYVFEGYSVGAVDYMFKPFQPEVLRSKVAAFVDLFLRQKRVAEQEALLRESEKRELELRHMRELWQSEARFSEIVSSAMDAIILFDGTGRITLFNGAAERMFGAPAAEVVGQQIARFLPDGADVLERLRRGADDRGTLGEGSVDALVARRAGGEEFPIEASVSGLASARGKSYTLIVRDISERRRQEEALRTQALSLARTMAELEAANAELSDRQAELEQAMTARSRFYASMSHELRTPINAVLGYSTLLLEGIYGTLNDKQREGIERTHKAAKHLLELVNDVLDLSKIEAGKIDLRLQPMTLPALIEDLFVTVRPLADQYGSTLTLEHEGDPIRLISDPRRVRQILLNLLSNAIKFGKARPIRVTSRPRGDGGVIIEVIDQGEGIPVQDLERIFQEFVQLGKTQLTEGTGLGLPISRRLAELLRGSLAVESEQGRGSTFRLSLPASAEPRAGGAYVEQEFPQVPADERLPRNDRDDLAPDDEPTQPQGSASHASG
ncbi:MAG TPA: ATP-binding protein, partial [Gemmatimonadaceae bacterium]|nr:ATP-binding protein [Gemmatimonadaceae bacterium]